MPRTTPRHCIVLVVDDETDIETLFRQRFRRELRSGKLIMQFAETGRAALDVLEIKDPDVIVIFSDIEMPEMNGLELLERSPTHLATRPRLPRHRLRHPRLHPKAADLGAHGYLTKPLDFSALRQIMFTA